MEQGSPVRSGSYSSPKQRGQACERCWKRKQKCDRILPACTGCVEASAQCVPRKFSMGPIGNIGGNLSHAAVPSYLNTLKRKRDSLNDQIRRRKALRHSHAPAELPRTPRSHGPQHQMGLSTHDSNDSTLQAAMGEIGFLSRSAMAEPRDEMSGFAEDFAMGRMVRAALALSGATPSQSNVDPYRHKIATINEQAIHIHRELAAPFITRFLDVMGSHIIHLDSKQLWSDFDAVFRDSGNTGENSVSSAKTFVVYMSVATGVLLSAESGSLQGLADSLHQRATKLLLRIMGLGNRIEILNSMLYLVLYSMKSPRGGSTWHLLGLAIKKAIAFRFHNDPDSSINVPSDTLLIRRNIFWSLYSLDRTISTIMDRPFNIEDDDITVEAPEQYLNDSSHASEKNILACQSILHARLMSRIRDEAANGVLFHYSNVCCWRDSARDVKREASSKYIAGMTLQLSSRAMIEILKSVNSINFEPNLIHSPLAVELDIMITCSEYIKYEYDKSESGEFTGGFVEGYDIFAAGVVIICLSGKLGPSFSDMSSINKCTALLTTVGERFIGLRVFRRVLWALSDVVSGNLNPDPIIRELPPIIPDSVQGLIAKTIG